MNVLETVLSIYILTISLLVIISPMLICGETDVFYIEAPN